MHSLVASVLDIGTQSAARMVRLNNKISENVNDCSFSEGFTPAEFKSSRAEKGAIKALRPADFMDDEDMGEFGIAHQKIQTKEDFGTASNKRKFERPSDGPIPGEPVLQKLMKPVHDKAAVRILKSMGWKDNQGIGSRLTFREKKKTKERNMREMYIQRKYGCDMGPNQEDDEDEEEFSDEEITFAPDDFDPYIANVKDNRFGLGYSGLQPSGSTSTSQHVNLFQAFELVDRNNKKLSIRGQAFGVGALEEEDDDIYQLDDMSRYDKSLEDAKKEKKKPKAIKPAHSSMIEGFSKTTISDSSVKVFSIELSRNFIARNWLQRKSRFAPMEKEKAKALEEQNRHKVMGLGRHDLRPEDRGALLNEETEEDKQRKIKQREAEKEAREKEREAREKEREAKAQEAAKKLADLLNTNKFVTENNETFKPFITNPEKQLRYEKFVELKSSNEKEIEKFLADLQPLSMSSFHREMEKKEFMQSKRMYKPLDSLMANRFIKEVDVKKEEKSRRKIQNGKEVLVIQRTKVMWKPHKDLCKRFNVPEPFGGMMFDEDEEKKRKKKVSTLFDYIGVPLNTKANFVAPQVIPRKMAVDDRKKNEEEENKKNFLDAVEKEKSFMGNQGRRAAAKDFFEEIPKKVDEKAVERIPEVSNEAPKTELEIKVAESIHKKPEDKKDLFRAIFCDSEDEDEEISTLTNQEIEAQKVLSDKQKSTFIESFINTKNASEINVLRNDEKPRGIFKSILQVPSSKPREEKEKSPDTYGPRLPDKLPATTVNLSVETSSSSDSSLDEKILKKLKKVKSKREEVEWVEKDKLKKVKKSKKHKKEHKKKQKKHKSRK